MKNKLKKICVTILVITLISGCLSSAFGISVAALSNKGTTPVTNDVNSENGDQETDSTDSYEDPTEDYADFSDEIALNDDVVVLTNEESKAINASIVSVENSDSYYNQYITITLSGEEHEGLKDLSYNDIFYLQGDENTPFGGDRILKIQSLSSRNGQTIINAYEPYFEDVFESMEISTSDLLTEENFVGAYYAEGVTSHFGDIEEEMTEATQSDNLGGEEYQISTVSTNQQYQIIQTATEYSMEGGDLIVEIDYDFNKDSDDDDDDDILNTSFGIKGSFGIKDLTAYMVCDMPKVTEFEELYFGLSGATFVDVDVYGKISAEPEMEASKKDAFLFSFEGLNEKRFPIAVFKFNGTTPVYITNAAFENQKESIVPSLYLILYADWEGKISLELSAGFEYTHSFNNGLRVFKDGEPCLSFEKYPYVKAGDVEEDGLDWNVKLQLEADTDLTLLGGSVLFYVAGVNLGELSVARIGVQAACNVNITASTKEGFKILDNEDTEFYIRGYLKILEAKIKLKAEGKSFLSGLSVDVDFQFALLDLTMFEDGNRPNKYKPKVPVSSMEAPTDFESVMTLVCDVSGSMNSTIDTGQRKLDAAKEAAKVIVSSTEEWAKSYAGNYGIGVVKFSSNAETVSIPHIDYKYINECIDVMEDGGGTSIHSGIDTGISQLQSIESTNKIMILMTDGQDYNDTSTLASAQKAADENIKIYTVGFGNDVNEEILKKIADATGGEYKYANTDNMIGIIGSFMYAQQASNAEVLAEVEDAVAEGETSGASSFTVEDKNGNLMVSTVWPGSFLDTILVDPNGRVVDEKYPGSVTDETKIPSTITVENPIQGKWSLKVKGVETSYDEEPFYTIVSFKETEESKINEAMKGIEVVAAYCIPIGLFAVVTSAMLLFCLNTKKKVNNKESE